MSPSTHREFDHKGSAIIIKLYHAQYELMHNERTVKTGSLYKNEYLEGWTRDKDPKEWKACSDVVYEFYDKILHSENVEPKRNKPYEDESEGEN